MMMAPAGMKAMRALIRSARFQFLPADLKEDARVANERSFRAVDSVTFARLKLLLPSGLTGARCGAWKRLGAERRGGQTQKDGWMNR